jgi:6-phosphofructokinase 1
MNAAIRSGVVLAVSLGYEAVGVRHGYRGLLDGELAPLRIRDVMGALREGGTSLGSARCSEFFEEAARHKAREVLAEHGVEAVCVIGGNGSLAGARRLGDADEAARGGAPAPRVVGVPASIDNDIGMTGLAIGVDTALNTIVEACDRITDTASAHERAFLVEVMGRDCGYLAMTSAVAAGADAVLFREAGRSEEEIVDSVVKAIVHAREQEGRTKRVLVIKAEGVPIAIDRLKEKVDAVLLARGDRVPIETRVTVLGHVVRGGRPTALDRLLASRLTRVAVKALGAGETLKMAAWQTPYPLPPTVARQSQEDPYCFLVGLDAVAKATAELLDGDSPIVKWRVKAFEELEFVLSL